MFVIGGYLTDKFLSKRYLIYCLFTVFLGLANGILPYSANLGMFFLLIFICGASTGSLDAGVNILCLDIWRGHGGDSWMHSVHFSYAIGAFLGPVFVRPFLTVTPQRASDFVNSTTNIFPKEDFGIRIFYPMLGIITIVISLGYLYFFFASLKKPSQHQELVSIEKTKPQQSEDVGNDPHSNVGSKLKMVFYIVMLVFFFFYVGMEIVYGTFLTVFAVESKLRLTKQQGADVTAVFYASFALARFTSIFLSTKMRPFSMLVTSFILCCIASVVLVFWGEHSALVLQVASAVMGVGMGPAYASSVLWVEEQVLVTNRLGTAIMIASSIGADAFPIIIGQVLADMPMFLMYAEFATVFFCLAIFVFVLILAKNLPPKTSPDKDRRASCISY